MGRVAWFCRDGDLTVTGHNSVLSGFYEAG